jgi:hypothetical protein
MVGRYTHAHQFNRTRRQLKFLRIRLGRVSRDIRPKLPATRGSRSASPSLSPWRIRCACRTTASAAIGLCAPRPRGRVNRQGHGRAPYEFGCKVSIATPLTQPGGASSCCAKALHDNQFDSHTLGPVITDLERLTGSGPASMSTRAIDATIRKRSSGVDHRPGPPLYPPDPREMKRRAESSRSSATPMPNTARAAIISRDATVTAAMPCSPPPATTSAYCCAGWRWAFARPDSGAFLAATRRPDGLMNGSSRPTLST